MFGIWRSHQHYADPTHPVPDFAAATVEELWDVRHEVPATATGLAHPVVAELGPDGRWRYLGWWKATDSAADLRKRADPAIYDGVRYDNKTWSGSPPAQPHVHPRLTTYLSTH